MQTLQNPNTVLIILGIIAIIIEVILGAALGFELLILGIIMVIGGAIGAIFGSFTAAISTIIILLLSYVVFGRKMVKKSLFIATKKTNSDSLIERSATVVSDITADAPGQVKIEGEIWRAESDTEFKKGEKVVVQSISGVTLRVTKSKDH
ncbi:NfeD family protein [Candidatus Woesebacteria bacterium]|nr:NfeD family protein [Candidatus Woesebacteria bacterium]